VLTMKKRAVCLVLMVLLVLSLVPITAQAEGRVDGAGMTIAAGSGSSFAILPDGSLWACAY